MPIHLRIVKLVTFTIPLSLLGFAPAYSQVQEPGSGVSLAMREQKETRAPQVMAASASSVLTGGPLLALDAAAELEVLQETQKRLSKLEKADPARALAEYKRFWQRRIPSPSVGVQVALKIVDLRLQLKDTSGALLTCEVMQRKYATDPNSAQLLLRKAQVLMSQERFGDAASVVDAAMPQLLAMGPVSYTRTSEILLGLGQFSSGSDDGKKWASTFYEGVEQVYLRWLKSGTLPHTWQMLQALQLRYQQVGDQKKGEEVLFKAADILLRAEPSKENPEGADASVMAARWLADCGRNEDAYRLYETIANYSNEFVTQVAFLDKVKLLATQGKVQEVLNLAKTILDSKEITASKIRMLTAVGYSYYQAGDFDSAIDFSEKAVNGAQSITDGEAEVSVSSAQATLLWAQQWKKAPLICEPSALRVDGGDNKQSSGVVIIKRLLLSSYQPIPLVLKCSNPEVQVHTGEPGTTNGHVASQQVSLLIPRHLLTKSQNIVITASSPMFPNFHLDIPLRIEF